MGLAMLQVTYCYACELPVKAAQRDVRELERAAYEACRDVSVFHFENETERALEFCPLDAAPGSQELVQDDRSMNEGRLFGLLRTFVPPGLGAVELWQTLRGYIILDKPVQHGVAEYGADPLPHRRANIAGDLFGDREQLGVTGNRRFDACAKRWPHDHALNGVGIPGSYRLAQGVRGQQRRSQIDNGQCQKQCHHDSHSLPMQVLSPLTPR